MRRGIRDFVATRTQPRRKLRTAGPRRAARGDARELTLDLAAPLSDADADLQPFADASPAKWHLAHTTWFFETFVLRDHVPGYRPFDERFHFLFNSYYEGEGERHARPKRGMLSRPSLAEVRDWRGHVDEALARALPNLPPAALELVELGINHEQQHQELLLTDMLAGVRRESARAGLWRAAAASLLRRPNLWPGSPGREGHGRDRRRATALPSTASGRATTRCCTPHAIAGRSVTNREWARIHRRRRLSTAGPVAQRRLGLGAARTDRGAALLAWRRRPCSRSPAGARSTGAAPVAHVSYYEADAFARWAGARLPTEAEWEDFAGSADPWLGHQLDRPARSFRTQAAGIFGDVWQWTAQRLPALPRLQAAAGAVGEYNGKFMSGQMVLKGASCATPRGHSRACYRNFFPPAARWQFTGVRLARDA